MEQQFRVDDLRALMIYLSPTQKITDPATVEAMQHARMLIEAAVKDRENSDKVVLDMLPVDFQVVSSLFFVAMEAANRLGMIGISFGWLQLAKTQKFIAQQI